MEVYFKQSHRLKYYELDHIDEYKHKGLLDKNRELYVVYGLPLSGKKKITEYLASNYSYKVFDINKIVEGLKKRLAKIVVPSSRVLTNIIISAFCLRLTLQQRTELHFKDNS